MKAPVLCVCVAAVAQTRQSSLTETMSPTLVLFFHTRNQALEATAPIDQFGAASRRERRATRAGPTDSIIVKIACIAVVCTRGRA